MPRTGWAALGAVVAALVAVNVADVRLLATAATVVAAGLAVAALRAVTAQHRIVVAAASAGALAILIRAAAGPVLAPPTAVPTGDVTSPRTHTGIVVSVGAPDGGQQRAVIRWRPPEPAVTAYVWLPRYPQVVPQDVVAFDGRLEPPPPDSDFTDYLVRSGIEYTDKARTLTLLGSDGSPLAALEGLRRNAND